MEEHQKYLRQKHVIKLILIHFDDFSTLKLPSVLEGFQKTCGVSLSFQFGAFYDSLVSSLLLKAVASQARSSMSTGAASSSVAPGARRKAQSTWESAGTAVILGEKLQEILWKCSFSF